MKENLLASRQRSTLVCTGSILFGIMMVGLWPLRGASDDSRAETTLALPSTPRPGAVSIPRRPLAFERHHGQGDATGTFLARGPSYTIFLDQDGAALQFHQTQSLRAGPSKAEPDQPNQWAGSPGVSRASRTSEAPQTLRLRLAGANRPSAVEGLQRLTARANYFIGNQPALWRTSIPTFASVRYQEVYPGIDLIYYGNDGQLEYDFVVAPGANPHQIAMVFEGADDLRVDEFGDLIMRVQNQEIRWQRPFVHQEVNGRRQQIAGAYRLGTSLSSATETGLRSVCSVSFDLATYDPARPLIIDPRLAYASYLGGSGTDGAARVALDGQGNVYVAGYTDSFDFPTRAALTDTRPGGETDLFIAKFSPTGDLLWSTYLGGSAKEWGDDIALAVTADGRCHLAGTTASPDFPLMKPIQGTYGGGDFDAFVLALNPEGSALLFSTFLGAEAWDGASGIALGPDDDVFVVGYTRSRNFPTLHAYQTQLSAPSNGSQYSDAFVARLSAGGGQLVHSTYYGRSATIEKATAVAVDTAGNAYLGAWVYDPTLSRWQYLVAKLTSDGTSRLFETRRPTTPTQQLMLPPAGIVLGADGSVYLGGYREIRFPADGYICKFDGSTGTFLSETFIGGEGGEAVQAMCLDAEGQLTVVGYTSRPSSFPITDRMEWGHDPGTSLNIQDIFIAKLRPSDLSVSFSTVLGGPGREFPTGAALDAQGALWVAGTVYEDDDGQYGKFPTVDPFQSQPGGGPDAFLLKLVFGERIQVHRSGGLLKISWPQSALGFVLESANSPVASAWTNVPQDPVIEGDQNVVTLQPGDGTEFFRLRKL